MIINNLDRIEQDKLNIIVLSKRIQASGGGNFTIWQNTNDQRLIAKAKLTDINLQIGNLTFKPIEDFQFNFNSEDMLFFKDNDNNILFKNSVKFVNKNTMMIGFPKELRTQELRNDKRYIVIDNPSQPMVKFNYINSYNQKKIFHELRLIDISQRGLALLINKGSLTQFHKTDLVECLKIGEIELENQLATIREINQYIDKKSVYKDSFRVGLQFNEPLPNIVLESLVGKKN